MRRTARPLHLLCLFALALAAPAGALHAQSTPALQHAAESIVGDKEGWGILAWSMQRQEPLISINADEVRTPASNNKVYTAIWALAMLGPDYRFPTDLLITAPIGPDGVLHGDVILLGSGDPAFGYPKFTKVPMEPLRIMAQQLRARGVRVVEGDIIGDATVFDSLLYGPKWPHDTGNGVSAYAPRVSGLPFQRNMLWVEAVAGGGKPAIRLDPPIEEIPVVSTVRSGGGRAWAVRNPLDDTIRVRGAVSGRGPYRFGVGVAQPALMTTGALRQALLQEGIVVKGRARLGSAPKGATLVHRHLSVPLSEMVMVMNRHSDNFFAEHLWKAAAAKAVGHGSYAAGGPASALFFHREAGVPFGELYQADGSGLSEYNRTSPKAMVHALLWADKQPWSELFHHSLPIAADRDGTLDRMFHGTSAAGNLHAKTGYINGVRTLSGFVKTAGGDTVVFSILYNGRNTSGARGAQNQLGALLAGYSGR